MKTQCRIVFLISASVFLVACSSIGPKKTSVDAISYADVVRQTQSEQLLRNIVHRTYGEPPSYVKITNITASYSLSETVAASAAWSQTLGNNSNVTTSTFGLTPGATYTDSPTISYVPVDDASIVTLLEKPITYDQIALLVNNGTNFMSFMGKVGFLSVGSLENGYGARLIIDNTKPTFTQYLTFLHAMRNLIAKGQVTTTMINFNGTTGLQAHFNKKSTQTPNAILVKKLLQVPNEADDIIFLPRSVNAVTKINNGVPIINFNADVENDTIVPVKMRSISTIIDFLSYSVRTPEDDLKENLIGQEQDARENIENYRKILDDVMIIYSSDTEPKNSYVKTFLHNHWFYIKMSDAKSKYSFDMLIKLMTLTLGYTGTYTVQTAPVITIPTGVR